jgi:hypothetical protein
MRWYNVGDLCFEVGDGGGQLVDFGGGFFDFVGGEIDSAVVPLDFGGAVGFVGGVFDVGILLLQDEVLAQVLEHAGDIGKGCLVLQLQGDRVEQLATHVGVIEVLHLGEDGSIGVGHLLHEDGVDGNEAKQDEGGGSHNEQILMY